MIRIIIMFLMKASSGNAIKNKKCGSNWGSYCLKTFCPVSHIRPLTAGRQPIDKYPVNTSDRSRFV